MLPTLNDISLVCTKKTDIASFVISTKPLRMPEAAVVIFPWVIVGLTFINLLDKTSGSQKCTESYWIMTPLGFWPQFNLPWCLIVRTLSGNLVLKMDSFQRGDICFSKLQDLIAIHRIFSAFGDFC